MTDGHPGWFKDPSDPTLARWHDGNDWTEHTLVIADQAAGVEPPPPVITPPAEATTAAETYFPRHTTGAEGNDREEGGGVPGWAKVLIPVAIVLAGVIGFSLLAGGGDDDDPDEAATVDTQPASLDDAVETARDAGLPNAVSDSTAASLITRICSAAERPSNVQSLGQDLGELPVSSTSELRTAINALGEGAEDRCPEAMDDAPELLDDLQDQAFVAFGTTTTAPTVPGEVPVEGEEGVDGGDGTDVTTRTTRRTTATTRAGSGATTTTAAPPTTKTDIQVGMPCSSSGATAIDKFGNSVTCRPKCNTTSKKLYWEKGSCPTTTTAGPPPSTTPTTAGPTTTSP